MGYGAQLAEMIGGAGPSPAAHGIGMGQPPAMPGIPPPPNGLGPIPTGDTATTPKAAADEAVLTMRKAIGKFPQLKDQLEATIEALKAASSATAAAPTPPPGAPTMPGAPAPPPLGIEESGSPGAM
jgi:hypothetical protein